MVGTFLLAALMVDVMREKKLSDEMGAQVGTTPRIAIVGSVMQCCAK